MNRSIQQTEKNKHINRVIYICMAAFLAVVIFGIIGHFVINSYLSRLITDNEGANVPVSAVKQWMDEVLLVY